MIERCLFATLILFVCAAPLRPMTLPADGYNADKSSKAKTTHSFEAPFLEPLQDMFIDYSTNYSFFLDHNNFLQELSNELIELLPGDLLETLIQQLAFCHNELEDSFVAYKNDHTIFSLLQKYLTSDELTLLFTMLNLSISQRVPSQQEQAPPLPLLELFPDQPLAQANLPQPLLSPLEPIHQPGNLEPVHLLFPSDDSSSSPPPAAAHHNASKKIYQCNLCNHKPFTSQQGLAQHKKTTHEGITYQCDLCDHKPFTSPSHLAQHKKTIHEGLTYQCDLCNHPPFADPSGLAYHKKAKHEGLTYQCDLCNHKPFTSQQSLTIHKQTKHQGKTYQCTLCDHKPFTDPSCLAKHKKTKHEGIFYQCDRCDHEPYASYSGLAYHKKTKHGD